MVQKKVLYLHLLRGGKKATPTEALLTEQQLLEKKKSLMGYGVAKLLLGQHLNGGHKANGFKIILNCGIKLFHIRTILMGFTYRFRGYKDIQRHCKCLPGCQGKGNHQGFS